MTHPKGQRPAPDRFTFRLTPIAAGCAAFLFAASAAYAQQTDPQKTAQAGTEADAKAKAAKDKAAKDKPAPEVIVVTGIRRGIEDAIAVKRDSSSIVEAISAEDIGKLPDVSIAESIARLPGLAAQRVAGRAQVISVRGLSPDFATTLLNGREQVSTGDNRGVEFDQYPSELLSGVTIYKTPDAALVGQGLSGTLDLQTVRPLMFGKRTIAVNLRAERNSLGDGVDADATGNRISATYIDQFANRTVGVAFGYAHLESPILAQEFGTYGWSRDGRPTLAAGTSNTNGLKTFTRSGENKRDGVIGVLEMKLSQEWTSVVDAYYSKFKREETNRGLETNLGDYNGGNSPGLAYTATNISNNVLIGGTATGVYPLVRGIYNNREDKLTALAWNNKFRFANWTLQGDISYSKAERKELNLETQAQYVGADGRPVLDTATFQLNTSSFPTVSYGLNYNDPSRLLIGQSIYGAGYGKVPSVKDELKSYKLQATLPIEGWLPEMISEVEVGFNYADRLKNKRQPEAGLGSAAPSIITNGAGSSASLGFAGAPSVVTWNVPNILGLYYSPFQPTDTANYLIQKAWNVQEKITTTYAKANLDTQLGGVSLRGNFGVQVQHTDQSSASNFFDNTAPAGSQVKPNTDGKTYSDVLPSLNLAFGLPDEQTIRVAVAKQIARPRLDQLKSAFEFGVDTTTFRPGGSGGNAKLDPWRANAFDVSYEKYFAAKGYVAVAGFYKDLKTYIFEQTVDYDFSRYTAGTIATTPIGKFTQPYNGKGGTLKGVELSVSVPFNLLSTSLDGFGAVASATHNTSEITIDNTNLGSRIMLPGLSKTVTNLTAYYEKSGFSTRISQRQRSDFIGEITGFGADRELRFVKGEKVVDFQMGYEFGEGSFKGLSVLLQVNNLTNSVYQTYQVDKSQLVEYQKYGRTVLLGVNYKM